MSMYNNGRDRLRYLVQDAKANGYAYVKSYLTAKEIKELNDPEIEVEYDPDDDWYTIRYKGEGII